MMEDQSVESQVIMSDYISSTRDSCITGQALLLACVVEPSHSCITGQAAFVVYVAGHCDNLYNTFRHRAYMC